MNADPEVLHQAVAVIDSVLADLDAGRISGDTAAKTIGLKVLTARKAVLAALRTPQNDGAGADIWHPIGTAPRDGTLILIWRETRWSDDTHTVVRWDDDWWQVHDGKMDHPLRGDEPLWWKPLTALAQPDSSQEPGTGGER